MPLRFKKKKRPLYVSSEANLQNERNVMIPFSSYDDFIETARNFHGCASPGLMIGAAMVELALHSMGRIRQYHALSETPRDLPDAIQLLTACTVGNGRLHILDLGHFAMTLYRHPEGRGVRVYLDIVKTAGWPHIRRWALGENISDEKELVRLEHEIRKAGITILSTSPIQLKDLFPDALKSQTMTTCICCGELHPAATGALCRSCAGQSPYIPRLPAVTRNEQA